MTACRLVALALLAASSTLWAQAFPSRPIRVIVPYQAGGGADNGARAVSDLVSKGLGQPLVVDN